MSQQPPEEPARDDAARDELARDERSAEEPKRGDESDPAGKEGPSTNRIILWVIVGGIALYLIGSGVYGILVK